MNTNKIDTLIFVLILLVFCSGFFSAVETAYSCANKIRLKNLMNEGNNKAKKTLDLLDDYDKLLSTILVGNNIVNITATAIATVVFTRIYGDQGATISSIVMTIVVLICGEVTPKSIAKQMPEKFAMASTGILRFLQILFTPINLFFSGWKFLVSKIIKVEDDDSDITDELITMVDEAEKDGDLEAHESDLISAAIEFNDLDVKDILTPRVDVVAVDIKMPLTEIEKMFRMNSFSRLPVYENSIDNIIGIIHEKDFYNIYYTSKAPIKTIIQSTIFTSQHVKISTLLRQLQSSKMHLAIVLDEYGGTAGIITLEDILEELVGEIWDEHDTVKEFYQKVNDDTYLVECEADLDDMFERFGIKMDDDFDFITVSGWVIHEFEKIPNVGDSFKYENLDITVTKADSRKVIEIKVHINSVEEDDSEEKK